MVRLEFAPAIQRLSERVPRAPLDVDAGTLGAALDAVFAAAPSLRGYLLDDQGGVRKHVAVFVNGTLMLDRRNLQRRVAAGDRIFVAQALSGG